MKPLKLLLVATLFLLARPSFGQSKPTETDSLNILLQNIYAKAKQNSVFRPGVNWDSLTVKLQKNKGEILSEADFKDKVRLIFETIGDKHGAFFYKGERLGMDRSWAKALRNPRNQPDKVSLKTKLLEHGYGYILLPPLEAHDIKTCQRYQDSLCSLGLENLKGLVVDLRLHEGGSILPLFVGLNQLYGARYFGSSMDINGNEYSKWSAYKGQYWNIKVNNRCGVNPRLKIVVLTSEITASAGEVMAIGLKGRRNTLFIGEPTAGLTTMNQTFYLGKYTLAIASSISADRKGVVYRDRVYPDVTMIDGDNFVDLSKDVKVQAALKWMKEE